MAADAGSGVGADIPASSSLRRVLDSTTSTDDGETATDVHAAKPAADGGGSTTAACVVVWDFDWSMVNENSDTWVVKQLGPESETTYMREHYSEMQWTALMDHMLGRLHAHHGVTRDDIARAMAELPWFEEVKLVVKELGEDPRVTQHIISDANSVFIEDILRHHGLLECFASTTTNPAAYDDAGTLRVQPHQPADTPHGCALCPVNLCKGGVLDRLLSDRDAGLYKRVVYVGDGGGDFCAVTRLRAGDVACVRRGYKLQTLVERAKADEAAASASESVSEASTADAERAVRVAAAYHVWEDGAELAGALRRLALDFDVAGAAAAPATAATAATGES